MSKSVRLAIHDGKHFKATGIREFWADIIIHDGRINLDLCAGFVHGNNLPMKGGKRELAIFRMEVYPEVRRQGIGREAIRLLSDMFANIFRGTAPDKLEEHLFLSACGFRCTGINANGEYIFNTKANTDREFHVYRPHVGWQALTSPTNPRYD